MSHLITIFSYLGGALWIVGWASYRALGPSRNQHLQSDWVLAARFIYVFSYIVVFVGGTGIIVFGGQLGQHLTSEILKGLPWLAEIKSLLGGQTAPLAPLFALGMIHLLLKFEPVGRLDRQVLEWLHSTEHLEDEMHKLQAALESQPFEPSEVEVAENRRKLQDHDVRFTDNRLISGDIAVVAQWRKVSCLLRFITACQRTPNKVLSAAEERELRELEDTDNRKTAHAFNIIRALKHSRQEGRQVAINDVHRLALPATARLRAVGDVDYQGPIAEFVPQPVGPTDTLEMGSEEFAGYIKKIQNYFLIEYDILLRSLSAFAAKTVIYAGDEAVGRLQNLKDAGYLDLGEINRLTIDNIVKLFCLTILLVVSVFFGVLLFLDSEGPSPVVVWKIGLIYAFATLCGAMIGSNRNLARRPQTPWAAFAFAGLMSFVLFLFVHFAIALSQAFVAVFPGLAAGSAENLVAKLSFGRIRGAEITLGDILPWALLPTIASVAICRISRIAWRKSLGPLVPCLLDGTVLAAVFLLTSGLVLALHVHLETTMGARLVSDGAIQLGLIVRGMLITSLLGFLMGSTAIGDIRRIAKSEL